VHRELAQLGVEIVPGDLTNRTSLDHAMHGVHAVFAQTFSDLENVGAELQAGRALVDAAVAAGVEHFVYSGGERTGAQWMDMKFEVEQYARRAGLRLTHFLHTAYFFENFVARKSQRVRLLDDGTCSNDLSFCIFIFLLMRCVRIVVDAQDQ
jgi:uncharacterized protein YbjT (DUF2867 family)